MALESSQAPELMLICDKWEQLKYVTREYFSKYVIISIFRLGTNYSFSCAKQNVNKLSKFEICLNMLIYD